MNVVDSSGWLEYFADGSNASHFAKPIESTADLLVPTLSLFEVFKKILNEHGEAAALEATAAMQQGKVIDLTSGIAIYAARLSSDAHLPLADSIILATARLSDAVLWTQDADFKEMQNVRFFAKKSKAS